MKKFLIVAAILLSIFFSVREIILRQQVASNLNETESSKEAAIFSDEEKAFLEEAGYRSDVLTGLRVKQQ